MDSLSTALALDDATTVRILVLGDFDIARLSPHPLDPLFLAVEHIVVKYAWGLELVALGCISMENTAPVLGLEMLIGQAS